MLPLRCFAHGHFVDGCLASPPSLQSLLDAIAFRGPFAELGRRIQTHPTLSRLHASCTLSSLSPGFKVQSQIMHVLQLATLVHELSVSLTTKLQVTLGDDMFESIRAAFDAVNRLSNCKVVLESTRNHTRVCWLKTICGAWTTSHRLHEEARLTCLFGCPDQDTITHYLQCPVLWQLAREVCPLEECCSLDSRLCLVSPSKDKLRRLAIAYGIFHACKNDSVCFASSARPNLPSIVQSRAVGFARSVASVVN